jgi:AAA15 family ATPase/GTPase
MIIEFTVGNFNSFKEKRTLSFEAKGGVSELKENFFTFDKQKLLRSIVLYGANSSGKSNLIKAFATMKESVLSSVRLNNNDALIYQPFLLSKEDVFKPTFFEIIFISEDQRFRYGFEYDSKKIIHEWLFEIKKMKENPLFIRTEEGIAVSDIFDEGKGKEAATNDNRLFISLVAQLGGKTSKQVLQWFSGYSVLSGIDNKEYKKISLEMLHEKSDGYNAALKLFRNLKLGFNDIVIIEALLTNNTAPDVLSVKNSKKLTLNTIHNQYDNQGNVTGIYSWSNDLHESEGTKKLIDFSGPIFDALANGKVLIIDELDSKLHPLITVQIIKLFNDPETNPNNAQLLFATHDTNLLSTDIFRRDQIWFTEKDDVEQTDLYSLDDFVFPDGAKVRKDANLEKNYIAGRYGAIPYINHL